MGEKAHLKKVEHCYLSLLKTAVVTFFFLILALLARDFFITFSPQLWFPYRTQYFYSVVKSEEVKKSMSHAQAASYRPLSLLFFSTLSKEQNNSPCAIRIQKIHLRLDQCPPCMRTNGSDNYIIHRSNVIRITHYFDRLECISICSFFVFYCPSILCQYYSLPANDEHRAYCAYVWLIFGVLYIIRQLQSTTRSFICWRRRKLWHTPCNVISRYDTALSLSLAAVYDA